MGERDASTSRAAQRGIESTSPSGGCLRFGELVGGKNLPIKIKTLPIGVVEGLRVEAPPQPSG